MGIKAKEDDLRRVLQGYGSVAVAFSGGVDSTLLAAAAQEALGSENVLLVTGASPSLAPDEAEFVRQFAAARKIPLRIVETHELDDARYAANPPDRCYYCKHELFTRIRPLAAETGMRVVADGANTDDLRDHRPGHRAAAEQDVRHPFQEAGLDKQDIRALSRLMGLPTWDKPAMACLASRIPYGELISESKLRRIGAAETALRELGLRVFRVRSHEDLARLELAADEQERGFALRAEIGARLRELGFQWVSIDLRPFASGSMNALIARD